MRKYIYVRLYFDPSGRTGLANVFCTDPKVLDWVLGFVKKHIPTCIATWEAFDLLSERCEFQLSQLDNKDRELTNSLVRLLCENGYEPFASSENYMHFRKGND